MNIDNTIKYMNNLSEVPDKELRPYLKAMDGWYNSLKLEYQNESKFTSEERVRWAMLARDVHKKGIDLELADACVAAVYQFCWMEGQPNGLVWADIFEVADKFHMQKPRVILAWRQLLAIVKKYNKE